MQSITITFKGWTATLGDRYLIKCDGFKTRTVSAYGCTMDSAKKAANSEITLDVLTVLATDYLNEVTDLFPSTNIKLVSGFIEVGRYVFIPVIIK